MTLVAHVPNLFDRSRFQGRAVFVETAADAEALNPSLVFVDLDRCEDLAGFAGLARSADGCRVIGFGPHVDSDLHRQAAELGFTEILARSVFFRRLPEVLGGGSGADRPAEPVETVEFAEPSDHDDRADSGL